MLCFRYLSRPKSRGTWPALREWEDIRLPIPKVSLLKLKQYKIYFSITITFKNANAFNNNSHSSFYILKNPKSNSNHAFITITYINLYKNIKHNKHADTCDTTAVSKEMQYHISLHSIAGEEWDRRNIDEVTSNSRDPGKIVEGSQTSLSKLISEMHGLKTLENILLSK